MNRPIGVTVIAGLIVLFSFLMLTRAWRGPGVRLGDRFLVASVLLVVLGLIAAEALWALRPHAFLAFTLWGICAMVCLVLSRFFMGSSGHGIRLMGPIATAGLVYAIVALYLRRAV